MQQRLPIFVHPPPHSLRSLFEFFMCHSFGGGLCVSSFYPHCFCSRAHHILHMSPPPPTEQAERSLFRLFALFLSFFATYLCPALHLFMLRSHSSALPLFMLFFLILCGRCSRSINFRWFVFCTCCVWVCVFVYENVSVYECEYFFVYTIFL